jgi:Ca-activated chloride channel family protein
MLQTTSRLDSPSLARDSASSARQELATFRARAAGERHLAVIRIIALALLLLAPVLSFPRAIPFAHAQSGASPELLGRATHVVVPTAQSWELVPPRFPAPIPDPTPNPLPDAAPDRVPASLPGRRLAPQPPAIVIESLKLDTVIRDAAASTTLDMVLGNRGVRQAEAVVMLPLPFDATVVAMELEGLGSEGVAKLLPRAEARRIYDGIVNQVRDPALVEFAGWNLIRSSVFPVPPRGTQRVRLTFDHILDVEGDRIDLLLPRSETMQATSSWTITVSASSDRPIVEAYSPTHPLAIRRLDERRLEIMADARRPVPGPFRLSLLRAPAKEATAFSGTVLLSPDPAGGGGHFLILGGLDPRLESELLSNARAPRELTLVIDRSGSMAGEKLQQTRDAGLVLLDALRDGDFINVIDFSTTVNSLYDAPRAVNAVSREEARRHLARLAPAGGTNIHDALVEALGQAPSAAALRSVLFLTDGLPTVGRTAEIDVRHAAERGNRYSRRVHLLGVGPDVNAPLLDRIGDLTRGSTTYVAPGDSIVLAARKLLRVLDGAVLASPALASIGPGAIADVLPASIPDLHAGEQLVILGRYFQDQPVRLRLEAELVGAMGAPGAAAQRISHEIVIDPAKATVRHAFVGRLWAARQIALLTDEVRQLTAPGHPGGAVHGSDPRLRELTEQIVTLSLRWGVLTEYTSFLAVEPGTVGQPAPPVAMRDVNARAWSQLESLAVQSRSGDAGVAQGMNYNARKIQSSLNLDNCFKDSGLREVTTTQVCQVADRSFFKRGDAWIDGALMAAERLEPARTISFGSPEHQRLVERLAVVSRQAVLSLRGDLYIDVDGEAILVRNSS